MRETEIVKNKIGVIASKTFTALIELDKASFGSREHNVITNRAEALTYMLSNKLRQHEATTLRLKPNSFLMGVDRLNTSGIEQKLANTLFRELNYYRNVCKPLIKEDVEEMTDVLNSLRTKDYLDANIHVLEVPVFTQSLWKREEITNYPGVMDDTVIVFPAYDTVDIPNLYVGMGRIETEWKELVSNFTDEELRTTYETYISRIERHTLQFSSKFYNEQFLVHGIMSALIDELPVIVRTPAVNALRVLGNSLDIECKRYFDSERVSSVLVRLKDKNTIYVYANSYERFLNKGGKADALLGLLVSNLSFTSSSVILEKQDELVSLLAKHRNDKSVLHAMKIASEMRDSYINLLTANIADIEDGDKNYPADIKTTGVKKIRDFLNNLSDVELELVANNIKSIYTDIIFAQTNLKAFYRYGDAYVTANPTMTLGEAVSYAGMELVTDLILTQVEMS